jgi:hypothetical protein
MRPGIVGCAALAQRDCALLVFAGVDVHRIALRWAPRLGIRVIARRVERRAPRTWSGIVGYAARSPSAVARSARPACAGSPASSGNEQLVAWGFPPAL